MTPEMPGVAQWIGPSSLSGGPSLGISIGLPDVNMPPPTTTAPQPQLTAGRQSQLGTLHLPGKTVSIAGAASIGPPVRRNAVRSTSEGTVQVVVHHHNHHTGGGGTLPNSPHFPATAAAAAPATSLTKNNNNNTAQPASSAAVQAPPRGVDLERGGGGGGGGGGGNGTAEPADSTTAISQAPKTFPHIDSAAAAAASGGGAPRRATTTAGDDDNGDDGNDNGVDNLDRAPSQRNHSDHHQREFSLDPVKSIDSFSSAAADAQPLHGGDLHHADNATASFASYYAGGGGGGGAVCIAPATAAVVEEEGQYINTHNNNNNNNNNNTITSIVDMPGPSSLPAAAMLTPATRMANGGGSVLLTPSAAAAHGLTPQQLQSVVSAALGRSGPLTARPGDSSSSGNRPLSVIVGLKRKKPATATVTATTAERGAGRPPMAPPMAPALRNGGGGNNNNTNNNNNNNAVNGPPQPTASSAGNAGPPQQADSTNTLLLAVEDAVSMVEQGLEMGDRDVACDAVSKASGQEGHGEGQGEQEVVGGGGGEEGMIGSGSPSMVGPLPSLGSAGAAVSERG